MKLSEVGRSLFGGVLVYAAVAACSGSGKTTGSTAAQGSSGTGGHGGVAVAGSGGHGQGGHGGHDSGLLDALTDPVPEAAASDPTSGSRLKAKYRLGDDGSKAYLPYVWYDSQRQEDCTFNVAADGKERCLPTGGATASTSSLFSDSSCTTQLAEAQTGCPLKYVVGIDSGVACGPGAWHLYTLGAQVTQATIYWKPGPTCMPTAPNAGYSYYQVGAEIPASSFVGSTIGVDP